MNISDNALDVHSWTRDFFETMPEDWPLYAKRNSFDMTIFSKRLVVISRLAATPTDRTGRVNNVVKFSELFRKNGPYANFMVFNVGAFEECQFDPGYFNNQVCNICTSKFLMPTLDSLFQGVHAMAGWLDIHERNALIVHCKNGFARSALFISCFLRFWGFFDTSHDALEYFVTERCRSDADKTWINSSFKRYLRYFNDTVTLQGRLPVDHNLLLHQVIINTVPDFDGQGSCSPELEVYSEGDLVFSSIVRRKELSIPDEARKSRPKDISSESKTDISRPSLSTVVYFDDHIIVFWLDGVLLRKDVVIRLYHKSEDEFHDWTMCYYAFNTGFLNSEILHLSLKDLSMPICESTRNPRPNKGRRLDPDLTMDVVMTATSSDSLGSATKCYGKFMDRSSSKSISQLSLCHYVQPDLSVLSALGILAGSDLMKTVLLQVLNNDIHATHESILLYGDKLESLLHDQSVVKISAVSVRQYTFSGGATDNDQGQNVFPGDLCTEEEQPGKTITASEASSAASPVISQTASLPPPQPPPMPPPPPPPLPLMLGSKSSSEDKLVDQHRIKVKHSLCLEEIKFVHGTVWDGKGTEEDFDVRTFEELFCIDPTSTLGSKKKDGSGSANSSQRSNCPSIITVRRANNIGIGLAKLGRRFSFKEIKEKVCQRSVELDLDDLMVLKEILPNAEEISMLKIYDGLPESLSLVEQFLYEVAKEPGISWMVDSLILEHTLESDLVNAVDELQGAIGILQKLRESPTVKRILRITLDLGNLTNYKYGRSLRRTKVKGFRLSTLCSLKNVNSIDKDYNLLHYLVLNLREKYPECLLVSQEFHELPKMLNFDSASNVEIIRSVKYKLDQIKFYKNAKDSSRINQFKEGIQTFLRRGESVLLGALNTVEKFDESWNTAIAYFGERSDDISPGDMINIFYSFFEDLNKANSDLGEVEFVTPSLRPQSSLNSLTDESNKDNSSLSSGE